ncbi:response regulator transcription factor [Malaciobacter marinus]|uniref:DNA-binding response regulator n=1 Tax=Malaciobacter marinus TaxID=505249 RepID=A0A347TNY2_9BACT|nr:MULTISPECIES: response regulator transcription factor [Malaciobacter]AXX88310.1 two-component system response regulator [Malaciobacter marinus]PHO11763.1 DNA-binding response regulator [Malaciobacter marinus]PHO14607.1 DNA-binding response regulator [Malaciobacter marinus]RYA23276.1 DNA-binding response regulator [Malaciobacter halophilus]
MKILLLEDNKRLSELIIEALEQKNYKVDWFENGKDAINAIYDGYDCFILDINVPGIDGLTLLKDIRSMDENTPAIIISANVELDTIKNAYSKGCDEYIKKPFYIYELETKLKKLCVQDKSDISLPENYTYNIINETLYDDKNQFIKLAKKEILLMTLFVKNLDKVVTFDHIEQYVWQGDLTTNENIRALVKRLRKKLPKNTIVSQGGMGYKLNIN